MGYSLRLERDPPLSDSDLSAIQAEGFGLDGSTVVARHGDGVYPVARWAGQVVGEPASDWQVAQFARLATLLGATLVGDDGETYGIRDGIVEQVADSSTYEFGKLDEILDLGPKEWTA